MDLPKVMKSPNYFQLGGLGANKDQAWVENREKVKKMKEYSNAMSDINQRVGIFKRESLQLQVKREKENTKEQSIRTKSIEYAKNRFAGSSNQVVYINNSQLYQNHNITNNNTLSLPKVDEHKTYVLPPIENRYKNDVVHW